MGADGVLTLPAGWAPRGYQDALWRYLIGGGRHAVAIWHRRAGKDDLSLNYTAVAAHQRTGSYVHMLPEYSQARKALWDMVSPHSGKRRIETSFPADFIETIRENEMFIRFKNGSTWQLAGSDNYDSLMGTSYAGIVYSEYALSNPSAQGYFSPILAENNGWEIFITTPRGHNHAEAMLRHGRKAKGWFAEVLTARDTDVFTVETLDDELNRMVELHGPDYGRSLWMQEYMCSFDAAIPGSVWGDCLDRAQQAGRIGVVPIEAGRRVNTAWDLGRTDATAIWWYQVFGGEVRIVDYHEANLKDLPYYRDVLVSKAKERGFTYDTHWLPHDARARTLAAGGKSIHQQMIEFGVGRIVIAPRLDHQDGIQAARATFPYVWVDAVRCEKGLEVLRNYHYEWDEEKRVFSNMPAHDWSSHGSSAFRTLALSWKPPKGPPRDAVTSNIPTADGNLSGQSFGAMVKRHLAKAKRQRTEFRI